MRAVGVVGKTLFQQLKTGKGGASNPLLKELKKNGIDYIIHHPKN